MIRIDDLDRNLPGWFALEAAAPAPDDLSGRVARATATRRPRPTLVARIRQARIASWPASTGRQASTFRLAVVLLIALLAVAGVAYIGSQVQRQVSERVQPQPTIPQLTIPPPSPGLIVPQARPSIPISSQAWTPVGRMLTPRSLHTATLLRDGRVLVAGGIGAEGALINAELWDPATGRFTVTGSMSTPRAHHVAALLPDGRVLVSGGDSWPVNVVETAPPVSAEVYDPATGTFTRMRSRPMIREAVRGGSVHQVATTLGDGRVFIAGGQEFLPGHATIFDPGSGEFRQTSAIPCGERTIDTVTTLDDGRVLLTCIRFTWGTESKDRAAALFDPATDTFSATASPKVEHLTDTAALLGDGRVLLVGRRDGETDAVDIYDPSTLAFEAVRSNVPTGGQAVSLDDGRVLIIGRDGGQLFDPISEASLPAGGPPGTWYTLTATRLLDGRILQAGGCCGPEAAAGGPADYGPVYVFDPRTSQ